MTSGAVTVRPPRPRSDAGSTRILTISTIAFTLMFAVWLMFGILGKPIKEEFGLTDPELSWIAAVAVLNGSMWRLPAGMLTDRIGGRKVMTATLLLTACAGAGDGVGSTSDTADSTVTVAAGDCDIAGHRQAGMEGTLEVA